MAQAFPVGVIGDERNEPCDATTTITASFSESQIKHLFNATCQGGPMAIIKVLFTDPRIDPSENDNQTIKIAAKKRRFKIVQLLLNDKRVNPGASAQYAFDMSCKADDAVAVRKMLIDKRTLNVYFDERHTLSNACFYGRTNIVRLFLDEKCGYIRRHLLNYEVDLKCCLETAAEKGYYEIVHMLVQNQRLNLGLDPTFSFRYYCVVGDIERVRVLLNDPRVKPWSNVKGAVELASIYGRSSVVKLLLADQRVNPAIHTNSAMRTASENGHESVLKMLLADPRVAQSLGWSEAVRKASRNGHANVVKLLLADPRVDPSAQGNRAVRMASMNGHGHVVELLLADPRVDPSAKGNEAVRKASGNCHANVMHLLLADRRVVASGGVSWALETASEWGSLVALQLLMDRRPRVLVTKEVLLVADSTSVIRLFIAEQPSVVSRLCSDRGITCQRNGLLCQELNQWHARLAKLLLLCVKRNQSPVVAARVADVLREVLNKFTRFNVMYYVR